MSDRYQPSAEFTGADVCCLISKGRLLMTPSCLWRCKCQELLHFPPSHPSSAPLLTLHLLYTQFPSSSPTFPFPGANPTASKESMIIVPFDGSPGGSWTGRRVSEQGAMVMLGITPNPKALVGKFQTCVAILIPSGIIRTKRDPSTDLYVLFNAWCPGQYIWSCGGGSRSGYPQWCSLVRVVSMMFLHCSSYSGPKYKSRRVNHSEYSHSKCFEMTL